MRAGFWASFATITYTYVVFPALVLLRGRFRPRPYRTDDVTPNVTLILAAHNEEAALSGKLDNIAELEYPRERLQVLVASDGSTDGSQRLVEDHKGAGAQFLALPRRGKCATLTAAIAQAVGEIVVFSDANSIYQPDAIRELVRPFADTDVGGVAGNQVYLDPTGREGVVAGERRYWDLDRLLKQSQSNAGSAIGGTGAIYAVRRELLQPIPNGVADDFFNSLTVVAADRRLVFAPGAVAYEPVSPSGGGEFARKVRVMVRGFRCILVMRRLLDPRRYGLFAVQLFSHKVLMRVMVVPLAIAAITSVALARARRLYALAAAVQATFYALAFIGIAGRRLGGARSKVFSLPAYFCLVNVASAQALWRLARGDQVDRWEPRR